MKKYCVAYVNLFDDCLIQKVVSATSEMNAVFVAGHATSEEIQEWSGFEEMEEYFFDGGSLISVIEISE